MKLVFYSVILLLLPIAVAAQTENGGQRLSGSGLEAVETPSSSSLLHTDSISLQRRLLWDEPSLLLPQADYQRPMDISMPVIGGGMMMGPLAFYGTTTHMTGLMDMSSGQVALHQRFGRWHLSASAVANKYWMSWQHQLSTQYGVGGMLGYQLGNNVSLHAFGYYYATNPLVGPAMSPYVNTTTYGGYADVRFSKTFGSKFGVRRYLNPLSGQWTTEPIVNPYIKIGDSKLEFPFGSLLKSLIWGDPDHQMRIHAGSVAPVMGRPAARPVIRP